MLAGAAMGGVIAVDGVCPNLAVRLADPLYAASLTAAEQRIEIITRNNAGKPLVKEFEPAAAVSMAAPPATKGEPKNVDVSLF